MTDLTAITARDPDIIAAEINTVKKNVQQIMIAGALEIGGKLVEAKGMVPHGQWGKWLEEKVHYSQSTANNMMKLYNEYGGDQQSLFDTWTNSQAFADMSYTQHLALLALPFSERQEFAETHQVADMSTRELNDAVKAELEKLKADLAAAEERAENAEADLADAKEDLAIAQGAARAANEEANEYLRQKKETEKATLKADRDKSNAEQSEKIALDLVEKLRGQLAEAEQREQTALADLQKARDNPEIPDAVMAAMRQEVEADAAQKATAALRAKLETAQKALANAEQEKQASDEAAQTARAQLEEVRRESKLANPDMMAIQTLAQNILTTWNTIQGHRMKATAANPDNAKGIDAFLNQLLDNMRSSLGQQ